MDQDLELPSNKQLFIATISALMVAGFILVAIVLPAEYGIDKTGLGQVFGLTKMGEIKTQLANEASADEKIGIKQATEQAGTLNIATANNTPDSQSNKQQIAQIQWEAKTASQAVTLRPGQAAEIKVGMKKGQVVSYSWQVNTGHVNFDVHGDNPNTKYFNYTKGKRVKQDSASITAAFDGKHGWFWRNRSDKTVTIELNIRGEFDGVFRIL